MDNQQLLEKSPTYKEDFKTECKSLIKVYHKAQVCVAISAILSIISSSLLTEIYFPTIQYVIIICSSLLLLLAIGGIYSIRRKDNTIKAFAFCSNMACFISFVTTVCIVMSLTFSFGEENSGKLIDFLTQPFILRLLPDLLSDYQNLINLEEIQSKERYLLRFVKINFLQTKIEVSQLGFQLAVCVLVTLSSLFLFTVMSGIRSKFTQFDQMVQQNGIIQVNAVQENDEDGNKYIPQLPLHPQLQQNSDQQQLQIPVPQQLQQQLQQQFYQYSQQPQIQPIYPNNQLLAPQVNSIQINLQNNNQQQLNLGTQNAAFL